MLGSRGVAAYGLEFYEDARGDKPVLRWIREELTRTQLAALGRAMREVLPERGIGVCGTEFGRQLGKGLFESSFDLHPSEGASMSRDFNDLMHEIEEETRWAGPKAMRDYAALGAGYRLAVSLIELRRAAGLTQRQLAAKSGVQQADISRIEAGDANPTLATIAALSYALGAELALGPSRPRKAAPRRGLQERSAGARRLAIRAAARRTS